MLAWFSPVSYTHLDVYKRQLLQSLLEISKMETGLIQINKKKLPLMDTVISAVNCTYPKADEKEMEFVFDYAKELETLSLIHI